MAKPYILPLGFVYRKTEAGTVILLTNPGEPNNLRADTPVTVWTYSPEHLALGKVRGLITAVGYTTATFGTIETTTDPRWPGDADVLRPKTPVFLALGESFDPDPSRMLTQEQANRMEAYARLFSERTRPGSRRRPSSK